MKVHFLGELPLTADVRIGGDSGKPVATRDESDPAASGFYELARNLILRTTAVKAAGQGPAITIED
jgi:hypothetical protein